MNISQDTKLDFSDVLDYTIPKEDWGKVISNAKKAEIGGVSRIRKRGDRQRQLSEDQLVGQIANYCACAILTGSTKGYDAAREIANKNPHKGDGGSDIAGLEGVDIKGSLMRYSKNPLDYRLLVREKERHVSWIYVLSLVPKERPYKSFIVGWAKDDDLPKETYSGNIKSLHGAYVIEARKLRKTQELISK